MLVYFVLGRREAGYTVTLTTVGLCSKNCKEQTRTCGSFQFKQKSRINRSQEADGPGVRERLEEDGIICGGTGKRGGSSGKYLSLHSFPLSLVV